MIVYDKIFWRARFYQIRPIRKFIVKYCNRGASGNQRLFARKIFRVVGGLIADARQDHHRLHHVFHEWKDRMISFQRAVVGTITTIGQHQTERHDLSGLYVLNDVSNQSRTSAPFKEFHFGNWRKALAKPPAFRDVRKVIGIRLRFYARGFLIVRKPHYAVHDIFVHPPVARLTVLARKIVPNQSGQITTDTVSMFFIKRRNNLIGTLPLAGLNITDCGEDIS